MSMRYTNTALIQMMAEAIITTQEQAAAFVRTQFRATLCDGPTPWSTVDRQAYLLRASEDRVRHSRTMRKLAEQQKPLPLALYLAESIAQSLEYGDDLLRAR